MQPTLVSRPFHREGLIFEEKVDGYRMVAYKADRSVKLISRQGIDHTARRVKTQGSLPSEDAALVLLFSLVASGQIKLRRIDGWQKIDAMLSQHTAVAA